MKEEGTEYVFRHIDFVCAFRWKLKYIWFYLSWFELFPIYVVLKMKEIFNISFIIYTTALSQIKQEYCFIEFIHTLLVAMVRIVIGILATWAATFYWTCYSQLQTFILTHPRKYFSTSSWVITCDIWKYVIRFF